MTVRKMRPFRIAKPLPAAPVVTPILLADAKMAAAKTRLVLAVLAVKRGALDGDALVRRALDEIDAARTMLRALDVEER